MTTFDQLRSALLDADPHAALDRIVQAELSAGRKTKEIHDELLGHIFAIRAIPEYTVELEDPLGDTLDALSGYVHPDFAYKDTEPIPPANGQTIQVQATVLPGGKVEVVSPDLPVGRSVSVTITVPGSTAG
jgi:hypothetical protein